jgi:hypothetical protein
LLKGLPREIEPSLLTDTEPSDNGPNSIAKRN